MDRPKRGAAQERGYAWLIGLAIIIAALAVIYLSTTH